MSEVWKNTGFIKMKDLPHYWELQITGKVHYSRKTANCPICGGGIRKESEPIDHYRCLKCGRKGI